MSNIIIKRKITVDGETGLSKRHCGDMDRGPGASGDTIDLETRSLVKVVYNDITTSPQDTRLYRGLLLNNDMKVLLISDSTTDKSAASLDVNIGQMCDPDHLPGLAHFCEHMLFLGTEKYPDENQYDKFLTEHGGSNNAYTSEEHTNFHFDVAPEFLAEAIDRFAQFFISPLFTASATEREVKAVNSENDAHIADDYWRINRLHKLCSKPGHPFANYGTGNKDTLDTIPKEKGINVRDELLKFHQENYSSNLMGLSVLGKESLDELEKMVVPLFSKVENKDKAVPEWTDHPYGPEQVKKCVRVVPVKDIRTLHVTWPVPDLMPHYKAAPSGYIGHLMGHEGEGSLLSELKDKGWANEIGLDVLGAKGFMFVSADIDLTVTGLEHVDDVVMLLFQYLQLLRKTGPKEWIYNECRDLKNMAFRFREKAYPREYTSAIAASLNTYPTPEVLTAGCLLEEYRPDLINNLMDYLTADNISLMIVSKTFQDTADLKEHYYGTQYSLSPIPPDVLEKWRAASLNENLEIPPENEYIPTDFTLVPKDDKPHDTPVVILNKDLCRVWFKKDERFLLPKVYMSVELCSPLAIKDPLSYSLLSMFVLLLDDELTEDTYDASLAGLDYDIHAGYSGLKLHVEGYHHKLDLLLESIMEEITDFKTDPERFKELKDTYVRCLRDFGADQPVDQADFFLSLVMSDRGWSFEDLLSVIDEITVERVDAFARDLLSKLNLNFFIYGNVTEKRALFLANKVINPLEKKAKTKPLLPSQVNNRLRVCQLPQKCNCVYRYKNSVQKTSGLLIYYQYGQETTETNVLLEFFCQIIGEPFFDTLRTQEQLGYLVQCGVERSAGVQGLAIIAQSEKPLPYVNHRIEKFFSSVQDMLDNMTDEVFEKHRQALLTHILEKPKTMGSQKSLYWSEIKLRMYNFHRAEVEAEQLKKVTKEDIINFYKMHIAADAPERRKLSIHVTSTLPPTTQPTEAELNVKEEMMEEIEDIYGFQRTLPLYPRPTPFQDISQFTVNGFSLNGNS